MGLAGCSRARRASAGTSRTAFGIAARAHSATTWAPRSRSSRPTSSGAEALCGAPISEGSEVELFVNGDAIFPAILETIRSAEKTLTFETYVYWKGDITEELSEAICERARAGVEVKVLLDALGSMQMDSAQIDRMSEAGAAVHRFRPIRPYTMRRLANRSHRRVLVADGKVGMTGGVGIAEEWTGDAQDEQHWRDTHVRLRGPVVRTSRAASPSIGSRQPARCSPGEDYLPHLDPTDDGRQGPARPLQVGRRRHERRDSLLPRDRLGAGSRST